MTWIIKVGFARKETKTPFSGEDMNKKSFLTCQCFNSSTKVRCLEKLPTLDYTVHLFSLWIYCARLSNKRSLLNNRSLRNIQKETDT